MNEITTSFFKSIENISDEGFQKTKNLWNISSQAKAAGLTQLAINGNALLPNNKGEQFSILAHAVKQNNIQVIEFLLENGIDINMGEPTPLKCAVQQNNMDLANLLIERGANIDKGSPKTPLCCAVEADNELLACYLIEKGADVNAGEITPLWSAVNQNNIEVVKLLLNVGANINKYSQREIQIRDYNNRTTAIKQQVTPVHQAAVKENREIIDLLLLNDADIFLNPILNQNSMTQLINSGFALQNHLDLILTTEQVLTKTLPNQQFLQQGYQEILRRNNLRPKELTFEEKYKNYQSIGKTAVCIQKLNSAKSAFNKKYTMQVFRDLCDAYELDSEFYVYYIANVINKINSNIFHETIDPQFIISFINIFNFLVKGAGITSQNSELHRHFENEVILKLMGHDPEGEEQLIKLFKTRKEKMEFIEPFSLGASWEDTFKKMKGSATNINTSEQTNSIQIDSSSNNTNVNSNLLNKFEWNKNSSASSLELFGIKSPNSKRVVDVNNNLSNNNISNSQANTTQINIPMPNTINNSEENKPIFKFGQNQ